MRLQDHEVATFSNSTGRVSLMDYNNEMMFYLPLYIQNVNHSIAFVLLYINLHLVYLRVR